MKYLINNLKEKLKIKRFLLVTLGTFVIAFSLSMIIANYSFGFKVSNEIYESDTFPKGYMLSQNDCINSQSEAVTEGVSYDGDTITVEPSQTVFCKLAFDVPDSKIITYDPSKSHAQDDEGRECTTIQCALDGLYELYKGDK